MKYLSFFLACCCSIVACKDDSYIDNNLYTIQVNDAIAGVRLSDVFQVEGSITLKVEAPNALRGNPKLLFTPEGKVIAIDNDTDFQSVYAFDGSTGALLNKIGCEGLAQECYSGLNDVALSADAQTLRFLSAGKNEFADYALNDRFIASHPSGVYGEEIAANGKSGWVVYNEFNKTEASGYNHLLFYDHEGNLTRRAFPYNPKTDSWGYEYSGFLNKNNKSVYFCPPLSDTVYEIAGLDYYPKFKIDFGRNGVPEHFKSQKNVGWDINNFEYLTNHFVSAGNWSVFEYFSKDHLNYAAFEHTSGRVVSFKDAETDWLKYLLQVGYVYPIDERSFAFALDPKRCAYLLEARLVPEAEIKQSNPELLANLKYAAQTRKYLIMRLSANGASPL